MNYTEEEAEALLKVMGVSIEWSKEGNLTLYDTEEWFGRIYPYIISRAVTLNSAIEHYLNK